MGIAEAIGLAIIQGLTEFLPVSSSGHLALSHWLCHLGEAECPPLPLTYVVMVHFGTLLAVVVYYRSDLWRMLQALLPTRCCGAGRTNPARGRRLALLLVIATIPGAAAGYLFEDTVDRLMNTPLAVGIALLVTATALLVSEHIAALSRGEEQTRARDALLVGLAQMVALLPGVSRSGSCIAAGLAVGFSREWAPRFGFLMSVPVILGGTVFKVADLIGEGGAGQLGLYGLCALVSAVSGYLAIIWVLRWVQAGNLRYFAFYCYAVGVTVVVVIMGGLL